MADRDHPPEFVAAEAWRVFVSEPKLRKQLKQENSSPTSPHPVDQESKADLWEAAWRDK